MTDHQELDRDLDRMLRDSGAPVDMVGAREILRGVLVSPAADDEDAWISLIAPDADEDIRAALRDLRERIQSSMLDDGLARRKTDPDRLQAFRAEMKRRDLDAFIVPKADEHQGEFIARHSERLQWLTSFSGSAGSAVVMASRKAAVFVDGRYTLQVKKQVDKKLFEHVAIAEMSPYAWLQSNLQAGMRVGFDPWLMTERARKKLEDVCSKTSSYLISQPDNPIDAVWQGHPPRPISPVKPHAKKFAGVEAHKKRVRLVKKMTDAGLDAMVMSAPDAIAWAFNIRGNDVPCTPVTLGFAILHANGGIEFFTDPRKITPDVEKHLGPEVVVLETAALVQELTHLGTRGLNVGVDLAQAPAKIAMTLREAGASIVDTPDMTARPKACKNATEQNGMRAAHLRDGIALCKFLCWLDRVGPKGKTTEWDVGVEIDTLRTELEHHQGPSFQTIAGYGANGAIVHYRAPRKSSAKLKKGSLLLVDSGGQYLDGTTDVTRTIAIGKPKADMCRHYTLVLKGHIALARAQFPEDTSGSQLDILARKPLWDAGLDYDHGTGHGVGSYLGVHEGPQRISKQPNAIPLEPGMVVSNEPGYYKTGSYGIRIENLVMVQALKSAKGWERKLLGFETLTCAPYDIRLIDTSLLNKEEAQWVNDYHAWVKKSLSKQLDKATRDWLTKATKPIKSALR